MRYLTLREVLELHRRIIAQSGGSLGVLNFGALESALAQPRMTFGREELYPSAAEKALALGYSLIKNHPFMVLRLKCLWMNRSALFGDCVWADGSRRVLAWLHAHVVAKS